MQSIDKAAAATAVIVVMWYGVLKTLTEATGQGNNTDKVAIVEEDQHLRQRAP